MFQKLYNHLEQINANTQRQQDHIEQAEGWAEKISRQLDVLNHSVNTSVVALEKAASERIALEKVALDSQRPRRGIQTAGFFLAGMGLVLLGILAAYTVRLSTAAGVEVERSTASFEAYRRVNTHYEQVAEKTDDLEAKTARLDSLAQQQAQIIVELKKLNVSASRTIFYLKREMYRRQQPERTQALVQ